MRQTELCLRKKLIIACDNTTTLRTKLQTLRPIPSAYDLPLERPDLFTDQCLTTSRHFFCTNRVPRWPVMHTDTEIEIHILRFRNAAHKFSAGANICKQSI